MKLSHRKTLYVDPEVQWQLLARITLYWASCAAFVIIPILLGRVWADPSQLFYEHFPALWSEYNHIAIPFLLLLPVALCDMLRFTNRLVGPVARLRREMEALASGRDVGRLAFREKDHWHELAETFNQLAAELQEARRSARVEPEDVPV